MVVMFIDAAKVELSSLQQGLERYRMKKGRYPTSADDVPAGHP